MYDSKQKLQRVQKRLTTMIGDYPLTIQMLRFPVTLSTTFVWNGLFRHALEEDVADYFLALHDDTEFYPSSGRYWSDVMTESLMKNAIQPNFGVSAPLDMRNPKGVTHALVHRVHYEIFGNLFPPDLGNGEHDVWMSTVYGYKNTFLHTGVQVYNTHRFTGRAKPCSVAPRVVSHAVHIGVERVRLWVRDKLGDDGIATQLSREIAAMVQADPSLD